MLRVVIESPLSGDKEKNKAYARRCMLDSLERGEAPYAIHRAKTHPNEAGRRDCLAVVGGHGSDLGTASALAGYRVPVISELWKLLVEVSL